MEKYVLNETPIRTARNFGINHVEVDVEIPEYKTFENVNIYADLSKVNVIHNIVKEKYTSRIGLESLKNEEIKIIVPENTYLEEPIKLEFDIDEDNEYLSEKIDILVKENSNVKFEFIYTGTGFHNGKIKYVIEKQSKVKNTIANLIEDGESFIEVENSLEEESKLNTTWIEIGGKDKISNYYTKLIGNFSKNELNVVYLGKENDIIDINYNMEAYGKKTEEVINVQGAITDNVKKNFKGTIDFKEGATKSVGKENENCMLLSPNAKSKSLPMLLCHEEDVVGEHGVSSGKIDENKLFYIMTKGISYNDAKKLIIKANFYEILNNVKNEEIKKIIDKKIDEI